MYSPQVKANFSNDLSLLNKQLRKQKGSATTIVVSKDQSAFYGIIAKEYKNVAVTKDTPTLVQGSVIVSHDAYKKTKPAFDPTTIITDSRKENGDRFYIYKTEAK
jgi:hypothetical protein